MANGQDDAHAQLRAGARRALHTNSPSETRALSRAVRVPMRRWWQRVGVWWLLAWALVLLLAPIDMYVMIAWGVSARLVAFRFLQAREYIGPALYLAGELLLPALWLWAAAIAMSSLRVLSDHVAAPRQAVPYAALFSIGWRQGLPLLPIAALNVVYVAMVQRTLYSGPFSLGPPLAGTSGYDQGEYWTIQYFLNNSLSGLIGDIALVMVLIALYVLTNRLRYSLILLLAVKLVPIAHALSQVIPKPPDYDYVSLGDSPLIYTCWLGLLVAALMLGGFCWRRAWVAWTGFGLLVAGSTLGILQRWIVPLPPFETPEPLRITLSLLADSASHLFARGQAFLFPLHDDVSNLYTGAHRLTIYAVGAKVVIPEAWTALIVAVAINLLWLAVLWCTIRWGILHHAPDAAAD